jgi:hypothetical protein
VTEHTSTAAPKRAAPKKADAVSGKNKPAGKAKKNLSGHSCGSRRSAAISVHFAGSVRYRARFHLVHINEDPAQNDAGRPSCSVFIYLEAFNFSGQFAQ